MTALRDVLRMLGNKVWRRPLLAAQALIPAGRACARRAPPRRTSWKLPRSRGSQRTCPKGISRSGAPKSWTCSEATSSKLQKRATRLKLRWRVCSPIYRLALSSLAAQSVAKACPRSALPSTSGARTSLISCRAMSACRSWHLRTWYARIEIPSVFIGPDRLRPVCAGTRFERVPDRVRGTRRPEDEQCDRVACREAAALLSATRGGGTGVLQTFTQAQLV